MAIFALCASAQGASPTKQEIDKRCSILQDTIELLRNKLGDIKTAEKIYSFFNTFLLKLLYKYLQFLLKNYFVSFL